MKEIIVHSKKMGNGIAIVDDDDFQLVNRYHWFISKRKAVTYATARVSGREIMMHRLILDTVDSGLCVDHKDHNGLNNSRDNLRVVSRAQNNRNKRSRENSSSKYVGVHWFKRDSKWCSTIKVNGRTRNLGYFEHESDAALAYNKAAFKSFGEFAFLNKV